ncbi:LysR family transcriptional regulator [Pelagibius marinus]|uniref:LysR family transcriptional regulator n=1 Tax=Pelagibius marinus TaxID=2762760 RepID=UPI001872DAA7|nr:LysR family transcriptional regulator [Pelagibius marinus]
MDVLLLRTMVCVADHGSFSAAAEVMNCVQSNITTRIRRLESHFGQALFERGRGGARLTAFGQSAYERAVTLLAQFEAVERDLLDAAGGAAPLRLGAMETTAAARLPAVLKALKARCPKAPISLQTGPTARLLGLLWERKVDAAFVAGPVDADRFTSVPAFRERLVVVSSAPGRLEGPLFAFTQGCSYRATAETWLRQAGRSDTEVVEMGSFDGILGCVEAGMGFAVAPERAVCQHRTGTSLQIEVLPDPFAEIETCLAMRLDYQPVTAAKVLLEILAEAPG